eukprot:4804527-Pyramimonas_sp.AAC.2
MPLVFFTFFVSARHSALRLASPLDRHLPTLAYSQAWVSGDVAGAAAVYHHRVPAIYERLADHYGIPSVNLVPALAATPGHVRDMLFRDDCHHNLLGAAFVASIVAEALETCLCLEAGADVSHAPVG